MTSGAYYNEIDPYAAEWLRNLIKAGEIAPGDVDERSIEDVTPSELLDYNQCHFFAGIGIWSLALRNAGWDDTRRIWTGSCPCQPFSAAGKGVGFDDERHLWPHWDHLISECEPEVVMGEQVGSKDGLAWFDLVSSDLEGSGYTQWAVDTCAAGFGAPHWRQRLYWVAYANNAGLEGRHGTFSGLRDTQGSVVSGRLPSGLGYTNGEGVRGRPDQSDRAETGIWCGQHSDTTRASGGLLQGLANAADVGRREGWFGEHVQGGQCPAGNSRLPSAAPATVPLKGFWTNADWLFGRDGYFRPVEPGTFPLANGHTNRMGQISAYGNAICAAQAQGFIESVM